MKFTNSCFVCVVFVVITLNSCKTPRKREDLVTQYCGSCHRVPDPGLLDKKTWEHGVLPEMAFRMGLKPVDFNLVIPAGDSAAVHGALPASPMVTEDEWESIRNYYLDLAPDSLPVKDFLADTTFDVFDVAELKLPDTDIPFVTLIKTDTLHNKIYVGTHAGLLYALDKDFKPKGIFQLPSAPSAIHIEKNDNVIVSVLGILEPSEQAQGRLVKFSTTDGSFMPLIDSLQRPVYFEKVDFNNDRLQDFVVCAFGNYTGALLVFENLGNGHYRRHVIYALPGSRHVILRDVNHDGLNDMLVLMAQGEEQILLLTNEGNFKFRLKTLVRFPPVYGSSYFDTVDFDHDGNFDLLYTNGDNGDFSDILKPYHGVRIFKNDGNENFSEAMFYPFYGASKAIARDFDKDGDLDIAAISFFPDFREGKTQSIVFLENSGGGFTAHSLNAAVQGRWLVMEAGDIDNDGDCDLLVGAFDYNFHVPETRFQQWSEKRTAVLILRNRSRHKR